MPHTPHGCGAPRGRLLVGEAAAADGGATKRATSAARRGHGAGKSVNNGADELKTEFCAR